MAIEIINLNPPSPYTLKDTGLITPSSVDTTFNSDLDYIEYIWIYNVYNNNTDAGTR